jgi:hypothetical protein
LATSSEHSLGAASGRQESWEFDSGARDLSPEPHSLHKLIEAAGGSLHAGHTSLLDLANKVKTGFHYLFREREKRSVFAPTCLNLWAIAVASRTVRTV